MTAQKEMLTIEQIKDKLNKKKDNKDKLSFLKEFLRDSDYKKNRRDLVNLAYPLILSKDSTKYKLIYDSLNEGLEPIYYWLVDYMSDSSPSGLDLQIRKGTEWMNVAVSSGYFGEMGQRATLMQQKAMEYLGAINAVVKSILNLIYDLGEFEIRLQAYDKAKNTDPDKKREGVYSLKGIWMDQVDARKGRASINLLAQDLQFVTLRDAFFHVNTTKDIKDLELNKRIQTILERKLEEYDAWYKASEREIRKRFEIERAYLRSQVGTLTLYANWVKPYLLAAQKLKLQKTDLASLANPHVVNAFSNMEMEIKLFGNTKPITPAAVHPSLANVQLDIKYYAVVEVTTNFRSVPSALSGPGGRQYIHGGRTNLDIKGFVVDDVELSVIESYELYEDLNLIEDYIEVSSKQLKEEIDKYINPPPPKKEEKPKQQLENPFKGVFLGFKELFTALKIEMPKKRVSSVIYTDTENVAKDKAKELATKVYTVYKKTHGMIG